VDVFPNTPDRKIDLFPDVRNRASNDGLYRCQDDPGTNRFPLALISPASDQTISSTLGELHRGDVPLVMHPDDAEARGLADNDAVRVFNDLGEVHCTLSVRSLVRPGTVSLPKGLWRRSTRNGSTGTALVPDTVTNIGGGACFNDARVQVASLARA
jgi:anaerobic selenocysteine-containing dehydrogenase